MNHQKNLIALALIASSTLIGTAQASLVANGNGLIYDNVSNITFTSDANLFKTQAASNNNLVSIIKSDTVKVGAHNVVAEDFDTESGTMNWWGAQAWIGYLNMTAYHGYTGWSLPATFVNPAPLLTTGYNQIGSPLGELFYNELGGTADKSIVDSHKNTANYNLFTNLNHADAFWSTTDNVAQKPNSAWYFDFTNGDQAYSNKNGYDGYFSALPILQGNAFSVPVPSAIWLFGSGLMALLGFIKRRNIG